MNDQARQRIQALIRELLDGVAAPGGTQRVYRDEPILRPASTLSRRRSTPGRIREMRRLAANRLWYRDPKVFYQQARLMADYEDDFPCQIPEGEWYAVGHAYQAMTDAQLRGYFTWRGWLRAGRLEPAPPGYLMTLFSELVNLIGVDGPEQAFDTMGQLIELCPPADPYTLARLRRWMYDFGVYHSLDPARLPAESDSDEWTQALLTAEAFRDHSPQALCQALCTLSSYRLENSQFYKQHPDAVAEVVWTVYARMSDYFAEHRKHSFFERLLGQRFHRPYQMLEGALLYEQTPHPDADYVISPLRRYQCRNGVWTEERFYATGRRSKPLGELLRSVDAQLRLGYGARSIKPGQTTKQVQTVIDAAVAEHLAQQAAQAQQAMAQAVAAAQQAVTIDLSKLQHIRSAALETQQKLIVDEEEEGPMAFDEPAAPERPDIPAPPAPVETPTASDDELGLAPSERRLLQCLLYQRPYEDWLRAEGKLLSVLVDTINDRLYDRFADTVLADDDGRPVVIEDYIDDLKGLIPA